MIDSFSIEITLTEKVDESLFKAIANCIEQELHLLFVSKLSGQNQFYWVFLLDDQPVTLKMESDKGIVAHYSSKNASDQHLNALYFMRDLIRKKFTL
jgi:hypothetical protein